MNQLYNPPLVTSKDLWDGEGKKGKKYHGSTAAATKVHNTKTGSKLVNVLPILAHSSIRFNAG